MIGGLILAAGAGSRFGGGKQLAELDGVPLLEHSILAMTHAPVGRVVVVLGAGADEVISGVNPHGADFVVCDRWDEGQSASLACGLAPDAGLLIAARAVQGVGGAAMLATTIALINTSYEGRERGTGTAVAFHEAAEGQRADTLGAGKAEAGQGLGRRKRGQHGMTPTRPSRA